MNCVGILICLVGAFVIFIMYMELFFPDWGKERPSRHQARPIASDSDGPKHWTDNPLLVLLVVVVGGLALAGLVISMADPKGAARFLGF